MRRVLLSFALWLAASCAYAQAPSPANVGISKGNPDTFELQDSSKTWTPFGTVSPSTHIFAPATNGSIAPNDCLKWGPGITSAGMACGSVGGGGGNQLTIYTSHSGLVNNVTTPTEAWTVTTQGFYAPGDGGAAVYNWNAASYCPNGTAGSPTTADGIVCVLPLGQSASTAGRYLLQATNGIDVRQVGMAADGRDNAPFVPALMSVISPTGTEASGLNVFFPAILGQAYTDYHFSSSFHISRHMTITCQGIPGGGGDASVRLVFADGVHGLVFDNPSTSGGINFGGGGVTGCGVIDASRYSGNTTAGSANITGLHLATGWPAGAPFALAAGDGVIIYPGYEPPNGAPSVAGGAYLSAVNAGAGTATLAAPYTPNDTNASGDPIWRLPAADKFTVNTTNGSPTVTVTAGPSLFWPGDYVWSDAFPFGTTVQAVSGTLGAQTLTMATYILGPTTQSATKSETGGQMWIIPAGIKMFTTTSLRQNYIGVFPFGLEMVCSSWGTPGSGCNGSFAQENQFLSSIIGRLAIGDNTGASTSIMNVYANNSMTDIAELGTVGSVYLGDNSNSAEDATSIFGVVGICGVGQNFTSYIGMYAASNGATTGYCLTGFETGATPGGNVFIAPLSGPPPGSPQMAGSSFSGSWTFNNTDGNFFCFNGGAQYVFAWGPSACSANEWTVEQAAGDIYIWKYNKGFGGGGGNTMWFTSGTGGGYTGYLAGALSFVNFPQGFLLYDAENAVGPGPERLVDAGSSIPAASFHKQGDIHFNQSATPGEYAGWINTADGANFRPFGPVANDTAGTQWTLGNYMTLTPVALASLPATCTVGTFAVINNGVAAPVYNAAVGSTTGAATDPVFCTNGNVWKYH